MRFLSACLPEMLRTRPQRWRARLQRYAQHFGQVATAGWVALQAGGGSE